MLAALNTPTSDASPTAHGFIRGAIGKTRGAQFEKVRPNVRDWHAESGIFTSLQKLRRGGSIAAHCRHKSFRKGKNERDYALGDDRAVDFTLAPVGFTPRTNAPMNLPSTCGAMASTSIPSAERRSRASSAR